MKSENLKKNTKYYMKGEETPYNFSHKTNQEEYLFRSKTKGSILLDISDLKYLSLIPDYNDIENDRLSNYIKTLSKENQNKLKEFLTTLQETSTSNNAGSYLTKFK